PGSRESFSFASGTSRTRIVCEKSSCGTGRRDGGEKESRLGSVFIIMPFSNGWLGFELGVLRRLKFTSVALPFTGEGEICVHLNNWKVRVAANDPMLWSYTKAQALVENNHEHLNEDDLNTLLDDAYVPHDKLENPALLKWFNETDAWWFDNLRFNAERLESYKRALALTAGMMTGDYVLSFNEQTRTLRQ